VNDDQLSLAIYHAETERLKALGEVLAISGISSDLDCGLSRAILEIARRSELRPPPAEPSSAELAATGPERRRLSHGEHATQAVPGGEGVSVGLAFACVLMITGATMVIALWVGRMREPQ
jgi:hypothetical protein